MKHLFIILLALLICATLHAQSVIIQATGAGNVHGAAIAAIPETVLTNLVVTGSNLVPNVASTNYVQIEDYGGHPQWSNSANGFAVFYMVDPLFFYVISTNTHPGMSWGAFFKGIETNPIGDYAAYFPEPVGGGGVFSGTPNVAYSYVTNYSSVASVTVLGKATP